MSQSTLELYVPELHCSGCVKRLEKALIVPADTRVLCDPIKHRVSILTTGTPQSTAYWTRALTDSGFSAYPITVDHQQRRLEQKYYLKRLFVCTIGMMQAMMFTITIYLQTDMPWAWQRSFHWFSLLITTPVLLYGGFPFLHSAWNALKHRQVNMDVPVALAMWIAYLYSVWALFTGGGVLYFDSICMFLLFLTLGRYAEWKTRFKAQKATEALWDMVPETAQRLAASGETETVNTAEIQTGDRLLVANGEHFPVDGTIEESTAWVNESLLTGEATPIKKEMGDTAFAGSVNVGNPTICRATHTKDDTKLGQIQHVLLQAQHNKPRLVQLTDRIASYFVLGLLCFATFIGLLWLFIDSTQVIPIVVSVLIVTCPCALSLATPTALAAIMARLAHQGIVISRSDAIEKMTRVTHFFFDKTGTLTSGNFSITHCHTFHIAFDASMCFHIARALEHSSTHPLAKAFKANQPFSASAPSQNAHHTSIVDQHAEAVKYLPGIGLSGRINDSTYWLGAPDRLSETLSLPPCPVSMENTHGQSLLALCTQTEWLAIFTLTDQIRPEAAQVIQHLQHAHQLILLSGDHDDSVTNVARAVGITHYHSRCLPEEKVAIIAAAQSNSNQGLTVMVGDGANDGPVLAQADVGVAMGEGTALARASADIILLNPSLTHLLTIQEAALDTKKIITQNLAWALLYNGMALPFAAMGWVPAWLAAIGMSCSSLLVVLNSMTLLRTPARAKQHAAGTA
ncbi:MAG: cation-translocating P-type ATPase [Gammaproteobacteria bacterium]